VLTISEVGRRVGLRPSAIRYYEQIGVVPAAHRVGGQRRYDEADVHRLAALQRARQIGFTLDDIRQLFSGFRRGTPAAERWNEVSQAKIAALEALIQDMKARQQVLQEQGKCRCASLEECGKRLLEKQCEDTVR
jgi:MerR family transcriptional regulator, redox-sensitive transcriptional activator SoxR